MSMDVHREPPSKKRRYAIMGGSLIGLTIVSVGVARLEPATPSIDRASMLTDVVRRGDMVREVSAPGTLVPEHVLIVAAATTGRIDALPVAPGAIVTPQTVLAELSNTDVELQALQAEGQLTQAEAQLRQVRSTVRQQRLTQQATIAQVRTLYADATRQGAVFALLDKQRLAPANDVAASKDKIQELETRLRLEESRLADIDLSEQEQMVLAREQVARLAAVVQAQRARVRSMHVVAIEDGVLQSLPVELGQWVNPGQELARIARPGQLKAVLRVQESLTRDLGMGQRVRIDTRSGVVPGHVTRIDPTVRNGALVVEAALDAPLPQGARADLSVDGTIEIDRLKNILYVARPAGAQPERATTLFKVDATGKNATRVNVRLGRGAMNTIEVLSGVGIGDRIITSDMSDVGNASRVRIH